MLIDSSIAQAYIESSCVDAFRASWLFEHTSVSSDLGRNAFTPPGAVKIYAQNCLQAPAE